MRGPLLSTKEIGDITNSHLPDIRTIDNYKQAIRTNGIKKIVGLSCIGAHIAGNTGNILMSRMLEHGFDDLDISKVFIRPSYYFSKENTS